jgi:hypothetical protein
MPLNVQIDIAAASEIVTLNGAVRPWVDIETARSQSGWLTTEARATAVRFRISRRSLTKMALAGIQ